MNEDQTIRYAMTLDRQAEPERSADKVHRTTGPLKAEHESKTYILFLI